MTLDKPVVSDTIGSFVSNLTVGDLLSCKSAAGLNVSSLSAHHTTHLNRWSR